ncbi:CUB domain containing protein 2 [Desmophyllum pertusum]|uniref:CUB domain containing protein 2 n=1 Tax=Desmophyllum pertusum TaxID=174260 RepID=A0A9W9Z8E9_9CNID|nr:CUB domain containing protein 2 [Desmophyllum pertusum]
MSQLKMSLVLVLWLLAILPEASSSCGQVDNNELKSPNYPYQYPSDLDCVYQVPILPGTGMNILFDVFEVEYGSSCSWDYLKITDDSNQTVGVYCGIKTGVNVLVNGSYFTITFHSDGFLEETGYRLIFSPVAVPTQPPSTPGTVTSATGGPHPSYDPSADPQSKLKSLLNTLQALIDEMSDIVNNELTGSGHVQVSVRDYKARVKRALTDVYAAMKSEGRQKRDVMKATMIDQLEKKAADLMKQLETKKLNTMKNKLAMLAPRKA